MLYRDVYVNHNYCHKYIKLSRIEIDGKRHYTDGVFSPIPSVTTILSETGNKEKLKEWVEKVGEEEAEHIRSQSASIGTSMHNNIERYILTSEKPVGRPLEVVLSKLIIDDLNRNMDTVWGVEAPLYYPDLYAGTTDLVGIYKGKETIVDFKNSRKFKNRAWITDYFLQAAAYAIAHDYHYGTNINDAVILIARWDGVLQRIETGGEEFAQFKRQWIEKACNYRGIAVDTVI